MAWQILNPNVRLVIWPGPYRDCAPTESADDPLADVQVKEQTEFSVQCYSDDKPIGPVHRFGREATLDDVWKALADYRS